MPENNLNALCYEERWRGNPPYRLARKFDENNRIGLLQPPAQRANPKGALYSHRSTSARA